MGDVQWLTAGAGVVHSEMFPLLSQDGPNPLELFQIWLNLPAKNKLAQPYFTMFWDADIPRRCYTDPNGRVVEVTAIADALDGSEARSTAAFVGSRRKFRSGDLVDRDGGRIFLDASCGAERLHRADASSVCRFRIARGGTRCARSSRNSSSR